MLAFFAWGLLVTALKHPGGLGEQALSLAIVLGLYLAVAVGCGTPRGLTIFASTYVACAALATAVAIAQGQAPWGCFLGADEDWEGKDILYLLLGASAALYAAAKAEDPRVEVRLSVKEALAVTVGLGLLLALVYVGARLHRS